MQKVTQVVLEEVYADTFDGDIGDFELLLIARLQREGFEYLVDGRKDQLRKAINTTLAANGLKPWLPLKGQARR